MEPPRQYLHGPGGAALSVPKAPGLPMGRTHARAAAGPGTIVQSSADRGLRDRSCRAASLPALSSDRAGDPNHGILK
jgi:hypothetical protein